MSLDGALNQELKDKLLESFPDGCVALDVETTGLSPLIDKIIELSAVKLNPDGSFEEFDELIDPEIEIPQYTIDIHGIDNDMVKGKPKIKEVLIKFLEFSGDLPLIGHNAKFDLGFMVFDIHQKELIYPKSKVYCSVKAARRSLENMPNNKLGTLARELDIPLENHHRALDDAIASMAIFAHALRKDKKALKDSFLFKVKDFNKRNSFDFPEKLRPLIKKVASKQIIDIKYNGGSHKGIFRPVRLTSFLPMPEGNILYAQCLLTGIYKSFSLKKIVDFKELGASAIKERLDNLEKLDQKD